MAVVYSRDYDVNLGGLEWVHPFDIHKYAKIAQQLVADGLLSAGDFCVPEELSREQMLLVHTPEYLESLESSGTVAEYMEAPLLAMLPAGMVDRRILKPFRHVSGGTILAARLALEHGVAVNIGGGYHHAKPYGGEGFCIYADMPIAIRVLQEEKLIQRVLVVDLDVHQGNGTIVCCRSDPAVFTFSMHQRDIYPIPKEKGDRDVELEAGTDDQTYLGILREELPEAIGRSRPDLVFFQAGCDVLAGDPLAELALTAEGILRRDSLVIDTCAARKIPVVMTLGGGYSRQAWAIQHATIRRIIGAHGCLRGRGA